MREGRTTGISIGGGGGRKRGDTSVYVEILLVQKEKD